MRLGLCCTFREEPIRFRQTTATAIGKLSRAKQLDKLAELCRQNAAALSQAIEYCHTHAIGCFRVLSQILPLKTHPELGYSVDDLPAGAEIVAAFVQCGKMAQQYDLRLCFHPDQFVVLSSPHAKVVTASLAELCYQAEVAGWIGADVLNIHAGGAYGDKAAALGRWQQNLDRLPEPVRRLVTIENDDSTYTPQDLWPLCRASGVPLVYDVHHHRCLADGQSVESVTACAEQTWQQSTWRREPMFHLSSPLGGWESPRPKLHDDYVNAADFPRFWKELPVTVEIEAKAKELAVLRLQSELNGAVATGRQQSGVK